MKLEKSIEISGERDEEVRVELAPAKALALLVTDQSGRPVEGARVFSRFAWPEGSVTDSRGHASVEMPDAPVDPKVSQSRGGNSEAWIEVQKEGYSPARLELTDEMTAGGRLQVTLRRGGTIAGRVLDHEGRPVERVSIHAWKDRHGHGTRTDQRGEYRIPSLAPGDYEVRLTSEERPLPTQSKTVTILAGKEMSVSFTIPDPATFDLHSVWVIGRYEDGRPASGARINVSEGWIGSDRDRRNVEPLPCITSQHDLRLDPRGALEVFFEESGIEGLYLSGSSELDGELYRIVRHSHEAVNGKVSVVYERLALGEIRLRVLDAATGAPVRGYSYLFTPKGHGSSGSRCRREDGRVTEKVRAGEVTARVEAEGFEPEERAFTLEDGGTEEVEVRLIRK
jgi:protocatechuate 3,4-dioxygenase beta subunit